uniref:Uncharacterized protein n=1 Tax=Methylocapsa acidiphila TaxID=133552 RepID=Q2VNM6_METAI|nr:hypothetical protein orf43 [Methylocapsa acidiphila]
MAGPRPRRAVPHNILIFDLFCANFLRQSLKRELTTFYQSSASWEARKAPRRLFL